MAIAPTKTFYRARCGPDGKSRASDPNGLGVAPRLTIDQSAFAAALGSLSNLLTGGSFSFDMREAAWLSGTDFATCTFSIVTISGDSASGKNWSISGDNLVNTLANPGSVGSGVFELRATDTLAAIYSFGQFSWSIIAPAGTDTLAPAIPTWRSITPNTNALDCVVTQSSDEYNGATQAAGVASYKVYKGGVLDQTVTAPAANILAQPTATNLGTMSPTPTAIQSGKTWTLTAAGTGIHNTPTEQCLYVHWPVTGAFKFRAKVGPYGNPGSNYAFSSVGLMIHETAAQGGRFFAIGLQPGDYSPSPIGIFVKSRTALNGNGANDAQSVSAGLAGAAWFELERSADLTTLTARYSTDGKIPSDIVTKQIPMGASITVGMFAASQVAGSTIACPISELSLTTGDIAFTVSTTVAATITVSAVDAVPNESAQSASLTATPATPPSAGVKKFNWGHYVETYQYGTYDFTSRINENIAWLLPANSPSPFIGIAYYLIDGHIEGDTAGDYSRGEALLDQILDAAEAQGRKVVIVTDNCYANFSPADFTNGKLFPKYLRAAPYTNPADTLNNDGGLFRPFAGFPGVGNLTAIERLWIPAVMDRKIARWRRMGELFDGRAGLECIMFGSTSIGWTFLGNDDYPSDASRSGFSYPAYVTQFKRWLVEMADAWPTTLVAIKSDWPGSHANALNIVSTMREHKINYGTYDTLDYFGRNGVDSGTVTAGNTTNPEEYGHAAFRGASNPNGGGLSFASGSGGADMRGKVCFFSSVQWPDWDRSPSRYGVNSIAEFADIAYHAGATHVMWTPQTYGVTQGTFSPARVGPTNQQNTQTDEFGTGGTIWANIIKPYLASNPTAGIRYMTKPTDLP